MNLKYNTLMTSALIVAQSHAASISANTGNPLGGAGYTYHLALDSEQGDTSTFVGTVGSWSWEDSRLTEADPNDPSLEVTIPDNFWRHQSDWIAVTLTEASNLQISVERFSANDDLKFFPSFTLFQGINDTTEGLHRSNNSADVQWLPTSQLLSYLGHHDNSSSGSASETFSLPAGDYTLLLGGNALSEAEAVNVNYRSTFTALPIPEPSASLLTIIAALVACGNRKR